ncbi:sulfate transporter family-domain-containing protein [Chlamydoabsidia padenii]|nr:sulfate transporter family-domain-containing protein [Chlamydoabsidia padenii]
MSTIYLDSPTRPSYKDQVKVFLTPSETWLKEAFPVIDWLPKYNRQWLYGDVICAITVGIIAIPQSMAYAKMAGLPPQYGLYSSVIGVFIYPWIGTSKDISIGTTAINSLLIGQIMVTVMATPEFQNGTWTVAHVTSNLTLVSGLICLLIGVLRLGILFDFICQPAIAGFMAGSGLTIVVNQLNKIMGIPNIKTTEATYLIFGKTLKNLPNTHWDAALGLTAVVFLYAVRYSTQKLARIYPHYAKYLSFINISRNIIVIIMATFLSFLINHFGHFETSPFKILGQVPAGFQNMGVPHLDSSLLSIILPNMVGVVVLQIMEHCSIATSLGKMTDYKIQVNQEIVSIGISNIFGAFFSAYPMTGAFSRTAVMAKSGSRTPLSNILVGAIVVLTIYCFTPALQFIPDAAVGAIICHAVTDLITGPKVWVKFWNTNPSELLIFAAAYIISLVTRIDISVYVPVGISLVVQLFRMSRPKYAFLGRLDLNVPVKTSSKQEDGDVMKPAQKELTLFFSLSDPLLRGRVQPISPGIICFQPRENLVFENVNYLYGKLMDEIKKKTRRGKPLCDGVGGRPWNDVGGESDSSTKPILSSIILDLSGVHVMDYTGMEALAELSRMVDQYCGEQVPWFIVVGTSEMMRHALLYAGFGRQQRKKVPNGIFSFHNDIKKQRRKNKEVMVSSSHQCSPGNENKDQISTMIIENIPSQRQEAQSIQHTSAPSCSTISSDPLDTTLPPWCYCQDEEEDDGDGDGPRDISLIGPVATIRDRYPYFFLSLHDATNAALLHLASSSSPLCYHTTSETLPQEPVVIEMEKME